MSLLKFRNIAGAIAAAGCAALAWPAMAADEAQIALSATASQIVVRDADSGKLRAATADEARALHSTAQTQVHRGALNTLARSHVSGARGVRLSDEFMSYSVLVRRPDGTLEELSYPNREAAEAAVRTGALPSQSSTLPTE